MKINYSAKVSFNEPREVTTSKGTTFTQYSINVPGRTWNPKSGSFMNFARIDVDEDVYKYLQQCSNTQLSPTRPLELDAGTGRLSFAD